jgi:hypothetical protein
MSIVTFITCAMALMPHLQKTLTHFDYQFADGAILVTETDSLSGSIRLRTLLCNLCWSRLDYSWVSEASPFYLEVSDENGQELPYTESGAEAFAGGLPNRWRVRVLPLSVSYQQFDVEKFFSFKKSRNGSIDVVCSLLRKSTGIDLQCYNKWSLVTDRQ